MCMISFHTIQNSCCFTGLGVEVTCFTGWETRYPGQGILSKGFTQQHQQLKATTSLNKKKISHVTLFGFGTRAHGGVSEAGHKDRGKIKIPLNLVTNPGVGRQKANSMIGFLKRNSRSAPQAAKETAYKTFVPPTIE